jgi:hypothetical protein
VDIEQNLIDRVYQRGSLLYGFSPKLHFRRDAARKDDGINGLLANVVEITDFEDVGPEGKLDD